MARPKDHVGISLRKCELSNLISSQVALTMSLAIEIDHCD